MNDNILALLRIAAQNPNLFMSMKIVQFTLPHAALQTILPVQGLLAAAHLVQQTVHPGLVMCTTSGIWQIHRQGDLQEAIIYQI